MSDAGRLDAEALKGVQSKTTPRMRVGESNICEAVGRSMSIDMTKRRP